MSQCRTRLPHTALTVSLLALFSAAPTLGESVVLRREYVPGTTSYIEREIDIEQDISGLPMPPMKFQTKELYGLWEKVESATREKAKIVLTYDRAARKVAAPMMGEAEFDTDDPEYEEAAPQLATILKPMMGMSLTMEVTREGKVLSFTGMDAINKKISELAVASMHWQHMQEEFTNKRGEENLGREPLLIYPNKNVKVSDTWKASSSVSRPRIGTIVTDYEYKVGRIGTENGRKTASISVTGTVSIEPDEKESADAAKTAADSESNTAGDATEEEKKPEPETEVNGTLSGEATYDVALGRVVKRSLKGNIDIKIPLSKLMPGVPTEGEPQFANFKTKIDSKVSVLTEKERNAQKVEASKKAEMRRKAEEEEDEEDDEDDEEED
ncbi:MAG: hypothetical protein JSU63_00380 [Phycisphaerales bacterium]|nr:MAG: hypothetical protein JSU63_00380 [Phycisphaerales bacterium]